MFRTTPFDKYLDKATDITNLEPDWTSIMALCDHVRTNQIPGKKALESIKNKLQSTNPNIILMTLEVLESCVKNCGPNFNMELATYPFMNEYTTILRNTKDQKVREKMLELISNWSYAFRNEPAYHPVSEKMKQLKLEGYKFPAQKETTDALFSSLTAPIWVEGPCCHRCRTEFTLVNRKHHCRACGQVFCTKCSSKMSAIPTIGFETPVRVCDFCYDKINKRPERRKEKTSHRSSMSKSSGQPSTSSGISVGENSEQKKEEDLKAQEEDELQLALALSLIENENNGRQASLSYVPVAQPQSTNTMQPKRSKSKTRSSKSKAKNNQDIKLNADTVLDENIDPEMERYLNRDYWVNRTQQADIRFSPSPSAPTPSISSAGTLVLEPIIRKDFLITTPEVNGNESKMMGNIDANELDEFKSNLRGLLDVFINRLNQNKIRGRAITNDHGVQTMFMNLTNLHSKMILYIQQTNDARANSERLQDKVSQIRDARAALDALRVEHREDIRRKQEEAERNKQAQMAQKLEIMRLKKQEYLQYQREMAIHRMQEQERELMMMRTGQSQVPQPVPTQQPNSAWKPVSQQALQYFPPQMQYPGMLPISQPSPSAQVSIGTTTIVPSVASDPNVAVQQATFNQQPPTISQPIPPQSQQTFNQYAPQVTPIMQQFVSSNMAIPYGTSAPGQFSPYVSQAGSGYGTQSPMHQSYQQPSYVPQMNQSLQAPHAQQQTEVQQISVQKVDEAPLINFD